MKKLAFLFLFFNSAVAFSQSFMTGIGIVHHPNVQAALVNASAINASKPNPVTLYALDALFIDIGSAKLAKCERMAMYALNDTTKLFSLINLKNPGTYNGIGHGPLVYSLHGIASNGATASSYIDTQLLVNRRAGIESNCSMMVSVDAKPGVTGNFTIHGATVGTSNFAYIAPAKAGPVSDYRIYSTSHNATPTTTGQSGYLSVTTFNSGGVRARAGKDGVYVNGAVGVTAPTASNTLYELARNNNGTAVEIAYDETLEFSWDGFQLTDVQVDSIRGAVNRYKAQLFTTIVADPYTTSDGKVIFLNAGDSKGQGTTDAVGPPMLPNTAFSYNRPVNNRIDEVLSADILNIAAFGSQWPTFINKYYQRTQRKPVFVNDALSGAAFYRSDDASKSWDNTGFGTLYNTAKSHYDSAIKILGIKPTAIFLILAINDAVTTGNTATSVAQATTLITRLNADYNNTPIYCSITAGYFQCGTQTPPSFSTPYMFSGRLTAITNQLLTLQATYPNFHLVFNESTIFGHRMSVYDHPGGHDYSTAHYSQPGCAVIGKWAANYLASPETDNEIKRLQTSTFIKDLTPNQSAAIKIFVAAEKARGNWGKFQALQLFVADDTLNIRTDLTGFCISECATSRGIWHSKIDVAFDGVNDYIATGFNQTEKTQNGTLNDLIVGWKTSSTSTLAAGTVAALGGAISSSGGSYLALQQNASNGIDWWVNCANGSKTTYTGATHFLPSTQYAISRSGSTSSALWIGGSTVQTSAAVSTTVSNVDVFTGALNNNWTPQNYWTGGVEMFFSAVKTGFDYPGFISDYETLILAFK